MRHSASQELCPNCIKLEESDFERVREYLKEHPGANAEELVDKLEIPHPIIHRLMQSGRLSVQGSNLPDRVCRQCGKNIPRGTMCEQCSHALLREIQSVQRPAPEQDAASLKKPSKATGFHIKKK